LVEESALNKIGHKLNAYGLYLFKEINMQVKIVFDSEKVTTEQYNYLKDTLMKKYYVRALTYVLEGYPIETITATIDSAKGYKELLGFASSILFDLLYHKKGNYPNYEKDPIQIISINIVF
jgi:hypothetical protein